MIFQTLYILFIYFCWYFFCCCRHLSELEKKTSDLFEYHYPLKENGLSKYNTFSQPTPQLYAHDDRVFIIDKYIFLLRWNYGRCAIDFDGSAIPWNDIFWKEKKWRNWHLCGYFLYSIRPTSYVKWENIERYGETEEKRCCNELCQPKHIQWRLLKYLHVNDRWLQIASDFTPCL